MLQAMYVILRYHYFSCQLYRTFGAKCARCSRSISATDWVRRAREHVYHLACFACDACRRQLSTGEEFALHEGRVLCKTHYLDGLDAGSTSSDGKLYINIILVIIIHSACTIRHHIA